MAFRAAWGDSLPGKERKGSAVVRGAEEKAKNSTKGDPVVLVKERGSLFGRSSRGEKLRGISEGWEMGKWRSNKHGGGESFQKGWVKCGELERIEP